MIRLSKLRFELRAAAEAPPPMAANPPSADGERGEHSGAGGGGAAVKAEPDVPSEDGGAGAGEEAVQGGGPASGDTGTQAVPDGGPAGGGTGTQVVQGGGGTATEAVPGGVPAGGGGNDRRSAGGRRPKLWLGEERPRKGSIPDEREPKPGRVNAYEQSLRNYAQKKSTVVMDPAVGTTFDSRAEAYGFYNLYSWEIGFGIRWSRNRKNSSKSVIMQTIVCCCGGKPENAKAASIRTGCRAMIRLHRSRDNGWYIREFRGDHNHPLSGTCSAKSVWPSHKHLDPYTKDLILHLRNNNMDLSKIDCIIAAFFGAMENVLFNKRALKSLCTRLSKEQSDDDVRETLELFHSLRDDPSFMYSVEADNESRIRTLLWTNGRSRMQYAHFGDAITFDSTYRTTLYDMPFGLFVGANNHCQSIILGGVLMRHETEESFKWVFNEFVTLMGGKAPSTILTDQCHEMELAIQEVLPETTHRWCKLHVLSRENECLGPIYAKKTGLKDDFHKIINDMLTMKEFESAWQHLLDKYNLHGNAFLSQIYDSRHKWAKPYFKEKFCGKQTSMRSNESANHMLKGYVPPDSSINMFVQQYNQLQFVLETKEMFEENRSKKKPRAMRKGVPIEEHAANLYTRTMFEKFGEIIFESGSYVVDEKEKGKAYLARHIRNDHPEGWSQVKYEVSIRAEDGAIVCECGLGEHMGMPCCHAVKVMIHLGIQEIPAGNIMKLWTRNARDISPEHLVESQEDMTPGMLRALRYSALYVAAMELVNLGASRDQVFQIAMASLAQAKQKLLEVRNIDGGAGLAEPPRCSAPQGSDLQAVSAVTTDVEGGVGSAERPSHPAQGFDVQAMSAVTTGFEGGVMSVEQLNRSAAQGSDVQAVSAVTIDDATAGAQKMSSETKVPGRKRKFLHHMTPEVLQ
ncbi:hypothetical protein ACP4OV_012214 [Aristida adscensionis]